MNSFSPNLIAENLRHPTNPAVKVMHIQDNTTAIWILRGFQPAWIDEMPVTASAQGTGKSNVAQSKHYDEQSKRGILAVYFGAGCKADDLGWSVTCVSRATEAEFNAVAILHSLGLKIGIPA